MKKSLFIVFISIAAIMNMQAQEESKSDLSEKDQKRAQYTSAIMLVPQYTLINGLRLDFEFRTGKNAIVIAPTFYIDNGSGDEFTPWSDGNDEMIGGGIDLVYKINLIDPNKIFVPYGALGLSYDWKMVTTDGYHHYDYWDSYYYGYESKDISIHKVGVDAMMGFQFTPVARFVIDVSGGVSGRYSIPESEKEYVENNLSSGITAVAFSGILPAFNVKLGLKF